MKLIILLTSLWVTQAAGADNSLPPRGKRLYLIENSTLFKPTPIKPADALPRAPFLRDPIPAKGHEGPAFSFLPKMRAKDTGIIETGKLHFKSQAVTGRLSNPRIDFELEALPVARVDEAEHIDFVSRIFETADSLRAMDGEP